MFKLKSVNHKDSIHKKSFLHTPFSYVIAEEIKETVSFPQLKPPLSYLGAVLAVILVVFIQKGLFPDPTMAPFVFFFPAVYLVAFLGGFRPGALAVILSALAENFFFIRPYWSWSLSFEALMATFLFCLSSLVLIILAVYFRKLMFKFNRAVREREKIKEIVWRANEEWNLTFDAISDLTFIQDKNFGIVRVNKAFADKLKLKPEEIVGRKCYQVLHRTGKPWPSCPFEKTRIDKQPHIEEVFDQAIGLPLLVTTSPIFNKAGEFLGSIHIAKDITELKRVEEALRKSEERMKRSQEIAHLGSWEFDLVTNSLTWSDEVYRIFGLKPHEFNATYEAFLEAVHEDDRKLVDSTYTNSLKQGQSSYEIEHRVARKSSGEIRVVYEKCEHHRDASGRVIRSVGMIHDITESKRIEEGLRREKAKVDALLASIGDSMVAIDLTGKILLANHVFADLVGFSADNLLKKDLNEIIPLFDENGIRVAAELNPAERALKTGKIVKLSSVQPMYCASPGKGLTALSITAAPIIINGKIIGAISIYSDVSREKAIDQAKTEFVSLASHQLRTPLASIALSIELLLRGTADGISPEQKKYLSESYQATKIMAQLIKVLLDISRIELDTFTIHAEPINLAENIDHLLEEQRLQFDSKKLTLYKRYGAKLMIQFDKNILRTTVENLITNAIRYTASGGTVIVSLEKNGKDAIIKITDNGYGIPKADQAKVFNKLFRAENAKQISADGAGLGLYLVQSSLAKAGARIWFESELNRGTTFFVAIPLKEQNEPD